MATLAVIAREAGFIVSGSDVAEEFITDKILKEAGISVLTGFKKENPEEFFGTTPKNECLFISTAAHNGFDNPEAVWARDQDFKIISHGQAVGIFMEGAIFGRSDVEGISVTGAHGKTTITGMIAACLVALGLDPSYTCGTSEIMPIGAAGHYGKGRYFVAEADEYLSEVKYDRTPKFLYQNPKYLIVNNIDFDHPDFYKNIDEVRDVFEEFIEKFDSKNIVIANGDDENIKKIINSGSVRARIITYGTDNSNEFVIKDFAEVGFGSRFKVHRGQTELAEFTLNIPGYYNAKNAMSVIALLVEMGVSVNDIKNALASFAGTKRRMEKIGESANGAILFDDYAHHPEEIRKTLEALRKAFPDRKIIVVFQAHTYSRTKALMSEFVSSFANTDELIILPTFASMRDAGSEHFEEDREFVEKLRMVQPNVKLMEKALFVVEYLEKSLGGDTLVLTMGAGDVYKVGYDLLGGSVK